MDLDFGSTVTVIGLLIAAVVADFRAVKDELLNKTAGLFVVLGAAFTALFAVYADKIIVR